MPFMKLAFSRFYDPYFVYTHDETSISYCEVDCYAWIQHVGKEQDLDSIHWMKMFRPLSEREQQQEIEYQPHFYVKRILDFPLEESDTPYLVSIYHFFKEYEKNVKRNDLNQLEAAIVCGSYPKVPFSLMKRMVRFVQPTIHTSPQRMRMLLSPKIRPFYDETKGEKSDEIHSVL